MPRNNVALSCEKPSLEKTMHIEFGHFGPRTTSGPKSQCSKPTIRLVFAYLQGLRTHLNESQITCRVVQRLQFLDPPRPGPVMQLVDPLTANHLGMYLEESGVTFPWFSQDHG